MAGPGDAAQGQVHDGVQYDFGKLSFIICRMMDDVPGVRAAALERRLRILVLDVLLPAATAAAIDVSVTVARRWALICQQPRSWCMKGIIC